MALTIVPCDPRAQRRYAERLGIADAPAGQRRAGRRDRGRRGGRRRLADLQVDDPASGGLDAAGSRHHIHHHERRHIAARRRHNQAFGGFQHHSKTLARGIAAPPCPAVAVFGGFGGLARARMKTGRVSTCRVRCNGIGFGCARHVDVVSVWPAAPAWRGRFGSGWAAIPGAGEFRPSRL